MKKTVKTMSILGAVAAAVATAYAVKNRKHIAGKVADDVEEVKERAALSIYRRIGEYPSATYRLSRPTRSYNILYRESCLICMLPLWS